MPRIPIESFGLGRFTEDNPSKIPLGAARDSQNLLHRKPNEARLRRAINRIHSTRAASGVSLGIHRYIAADLSDIFLQKIGTDLYAFSDLSAATTGSSILSSMTASWITAFANANGSAFLADSAKCYLSRGTSGTTYELGRTASAVGFTLASAGTATGNAAGVVYYATTDVTPEGVETPPCTATSVSRSADAGVTVTNASLSFTAPYTKKRLWRTKASGTQFYLVAGNLDAGSFPYADTSLDTSLTTVSDVHGNNVLTASIEKPEGAKHLAWHRNRLFLANLSGNLPSRIRWSKIGEPTQFESRTSARQELGRLDGGEITGVVSFRGQLVCFKTTGIWTLNGDVDDTGFVWSEAVTGKGCIAPRSIFVDADKAIYFLATDGVYSFDLAEVREASSNLSDFDDLETDRYDLFCAGICPVTRRYLLAVTPNAGSTNTAVHALNLDSGAWGKEEYAEGVVKPSCFAVFENADGKEKLFMGDASGYLYEHDTTAGADGVSSGDKSGTITAYAAETGIITCGGAAFKNLGDKHKALSVTLVRAADGSTESKEITTNDATTITPASNVWTGTAPAVGDVVYVGAFEWVLYLDRMDLGTGRRKRFDRVEIEFEKQSHTVPVRLGYVLDADAAPTATTSYTVNEGYVARRRIDRRGTGLSIYMASIGVDHTFDLIALTVDATVLDVRLPSR